MGRTATAASGNGRDSGAEPTAIPVPGLTGVVAVAAGVASSMALRQDGVVLTWGQNGAGHSWGWATMYRAR